MKNKTKSKILLLSSITFGLITTTLVSCSNTDQKSAPKINFDFNGIKGITTTAKSNYAVGETVSFKLNYDATNIIVDEVKLEEPYQLFKYGDEYKFIMPEKDIKVSVLARYNKNLKAKLQEVIDSRNYTVVSRITLKNEQYDTIAQFTENANMFHVENDKEQIRYGEINGEEGIYNFQIELNDKLEEEFNVTKTTYSSYKNNIKSYWDEGHEHGGLHRLNIDRIRPNDDVYNFREVEFYNRTQIFYPTGLKMSTFLSALDGISVTVNDSNNVEFTIKLRDDIGIITEEVVNIGKTKIKVVDNYLENGGKATPSVLTPKQAEIKRLIDANNYREPLPEIDYVDDFGKKKSLKQGYIYYHPSYLYIDYTDEFIEYAKKEGSLLNYDDNGYIQLDNKVYPFSIPERNGERTFVLNDNPNEVETGNLPEVVGFFSSTGFMKNYNRANKERLYLNASSYIPYDLIEDYEIGYECGVDVFHLDSNKVQEEMILQGSQGIGLTDMVDDNLLVIYLQNDQVAAVSYEKFGQTKIDFIEDKIAELTAK